MSDKANSNESGRRRFLKAGTLGAVGLLLGNVKAVSLSPVVASAATATSFGPPVNCAVIGAGAHGRQVLSELSRIPGAVLHSACDTYAPALRRVSRDFPEMKRSEDYRAVLDDREVRAVFVVTPSHLHREIAVAALDAGKHVYCEAPLATTIDDARAIALAAKNANGRSIFQSGLQRRAEPQHKFVHTFLQTGALGTPLHGRSQWHRKESWRRVAPTQDREREANWRLRRESSAGLLGEIGLHHIDAVAWFLGQRPTSVTGFGGIQLWKDGREVEDTVQAVFEFPGGVNYSIGCTLGNSFEGAFDTIYGSDSAILIRDTRAWMFREADAPLLGWEVYARQERFFQDTGISLMADATQLASDGVDLETVEVATENPLFCSLLDFIECIQEDMVPHAGFQEGLDAAILAIKANEAVTTRQPIQFTDEWFHLS